MVIGLTVAIGSMVVVGGFLAKIPLPTAAPGDESSKVYDVQGREVGSFHGEQNRTIVPLSAISNNLKDAVVAAEDRSFFTHPGVSLRGIFRAALTNFRQGEIGQGASTITQQYARAVSGIGTERSYLRKLKEATLAVKMEKTLTKNKILENYLNTVYFGRGAYGAEAAAQTYFKKPSRDLDVAESAYLAGIIRSPNTYQYDGNPAGPSVQAVATIKDRVLDAMLASGYVDQARLAEGKAVQLHTRFIFGQSAEQDSPVAGYFIEYVRKLLLGEFQISEADLLGGGLKIYTTLDLDMQLAAEEAVRSTMDLPTDPEVALLAMEPQGHVKAMVGGRVVDDFERARGFNFAANLPGEDGGRQAGSAFKIFGAAALLDEGKSVNSVFNAPSSIEITSRRCRNADGSAWKVSNFGNAGYGPMNMIEATTRSVNTVYAQMMEKVVSPANFMSMAAKAGISIPQVDAGCALTLGTSPVTPLEMARAYVTFAARGKRPEPLVITRVEASDGTLLHERRPRTEQTIDRNVADTVNWILKQNIQRGTGTGAKLPWPAMGKTGTSQNNGDASFAGATPELAAVVWMGYAPVQQTDSNGRVKTVIPLMDSVHGRQVTGGSFPATIWKKFMAEALKKYPEHSDFPTPKITGEVLNPPPVCPDPVKRIDEGGQPGDSGDEDDQSFEIASAADGNTQEDRDPRCPQPVPSPAPTPEFCGFEPCEEGEEPDTSVTLPAMPTTSPCFPFDCDDDDVREPRETTTTRPPRGSTTTTDPPISPTVPDDDCFPLCPSPDPDPAPDEEED